jgi:cbb3-type cytochrome oxidase subunit 3
MLSNFTKSQKWTIAITIFSVILVFFPFKKFKKSEIVINDNDQSKRIELLESKIKKLNVQQIQYDSAFKTMTDSIICLQYEIEKKELQILNLKRKKHETNNVVRSFNDSDITNFFSNRYK